MKLKGRISILVDGDGASIEIDDATSTLPLAIIKMSAVDFCAALGRLANIPCEIETTSPLENIGKKMEWTYFEFEMPAKVEWKNRKEVAFQIAQQVCPEGWVFDNYFGSRDSFFTRDGKDMARMTIRRWV